LIKKLGLVAGARATFVGEPNGFRELLGPLPDGVRVSTQLRRTKDYVHVFVTSASVLRRKLSSVVRVLDADGLAWISWPKKSSGVSTDVDGGTVRQLGLEAGLVDVKVCAVDEVWSGHKFVFRKEERQRIRERAQRPRTTQRRS